MNIFIYVAMICAFISAMSLFFLIAGIVKDITERYRERYIREASTELDDVLSELPPSYVFNVSLALAGAAVLVTSVVIVLTADPVRFDPKIMDYVGGFPWVKMIFFDFITGMIVFLSPRAYLRYKRRKRLEKFNEQLIDALGAMSSALKAGFSINQAIDAVAADKIKPISDEFGLLVRELRLGVAFETALEKMNQRLKLDDFELIAAAIITARQTGGELTVVFDRLASMIRERLRVNGRIKSLTAQGRMQAKIIGAMPYLLLAAMWFVSPVMTRTFYNSPAGIIVLACVTVLVILGFLWIRKITNIDI